MASERKKLNSKITIIIGLALILISFVMLALTLYPFVRSELGYVTNPPDKDSRVFAEADSFISKSTPVIVAADKDFSIVVPKIGANAKVLENIDPNNSYLYQKALTQGVAHAKGTSLPDQPGNTFLFAHSSDSFINANMYNSVFYLLHRMSQEDLFYIAYKGKLYKYKVIKIDYVSSGDTGYYNYKTPEAEYTATLMTCWPPATTFKRLMVVGALQQ